MEPESCRLKLIFPILQPTVLYLLDAGWLEIQTPTNLQVLNILKQVLDLSEAEAISLAVELSADGLLIDKRLNRTLQQVMG